MSACQLKKILRVSLSTPPLLAFHHFCTSTPPPSLRQTYLAARPRTRYDPHFSTLVPVLLLSPALSLSDAGKGRWERMSAFAEAPVMEGGGLWSTGGEGEGCGTCSHRSMMIERIPKPLPSKPSLSWFMPRPAAYSRLRSEEPPVLHSSVSCCSMPGGARS